MKIRVFKTSLLPPSARKPAAIQKACEAALKLEKCKAKGELNVIFLDKRRMREMNRMFLKHDYDTDVIAFRYAGAKVAAGEPFGDVYISAYMARRQAREVRHSVLDEVLTLAVHGTLHLLGYDDGSPAKKREMFARQDEVLRRN